MRNVKDCAHTLDSLEVKTNDFLGFDVVCLVTRMLITDILDLISREFDEDLRLLCHVFIPSFLSYNDQF